MADYRTELINLIEKQCHQSPTFGAEVGVHRGKTAYALLNYFQRLHLYLVDSWTVAKEQTADSMTRFTQEEQEKYFREAQDQVRFFGNRAEILRMDSVAAVGEMQPLCWAFIDADHSFAGCSRDIAAYWNQIRPGGLLIGHDYGKDELPGVTLAVNTFVQANGLELKTQEGHLWWLRKHRS